MELVCIGIERGNSVALDEIERKSGAYQIDKDLNKHNLRSVGDLRPNRWNICE